MSIYYPSSESQRLRSPFDDIFERETAPRVQSASSIAHNRQRRPSTDGFNGPGIDHEFTCFRAQDAERHRHSPSIRSQMRPQQPPLPEKTNHRIENRYWFEKCISAALNGLISAYVVALRICLWYRNLSLLIIVLSYLILLIMQVFETIYCSGHPRKTVNEECVPRIDISALYPYASQPHLRFHILSIDTLTMLFWLSPRERALMLFWKESAKDRGVLQRQSAAQRSVSHIFRCLTYGMFVISFVLVTHKQ